MGLGIRVAEKGWVPDALIRRAIRQLLEKRRGELEFGGVESQGIRLQNFISEMLKAPIALETRAANEQHYEMPPDFMKLVLGPRMKYSSCLYRSGTESLQEAEETMLQLTAERAELKDGQNILELGCGWGSLSLWMAEQFPRANVLGISNSKPQREFILSHARERKIKNLDIQTVDINEFTIPSQQYDRIVSVEMFEHTRNWKMLFKKIAEGLKSDGKLFFHIFTHHAHPYAFETDGDDNWLGKYFFTGGMMPSDALPFYFQNDLQFECSWRVSGRHYGQTAEHWLRNLDENRESAFESFKKVFGADQAATWIQRWRIFFMSCAELWNYRDGNEWLVSHYRAVRR